MASVAGIQMDLKDVAFHIKKKQGFPSVTDTGVADIFLGGTGLSFKMKMSSADKKDQQNFFKVDKVDVDVKNFNIKLKQSKHKTLFALGKPLMLKVMRPALQKVIEKLIKDKVHELDSLLYQVKLEADRAMQEVKENPEEAPNVYSRYANALQKQLLQGKQKAEAVASDKKVNVAMTKQDSIFPNIHLPGGISSKATEYKELGQKGETWHSPIFKLGSAAATTNLPSAPSVTRKQHNVTSGGIRGPQNIGNTESMTNQLHDPSAQAAAGDSGYGSQSAAGSTGYGNQSVGNGNGTTGFANQLDQSFNQNGSTGLNGNGNSKVSNGHTTLGANNPVMTGNY